MPDDTPHLANSPPRATRRPCFTLLLYALFFIVALGTIAWLSYSWYLKRQIENTYSAADIAAAKVWATTPHPFPAHLLPPFEPFPPELDEKHRTYIDHVEKLSSLIYMQVYEDLGYTESKLREHAPLTPEERADATTVTAQFLPLLEEARELTAHPDYRRLNPADSMKQNEYFSWNDKQVFRLIAQVYVYNQDYPAAIDVTDILLRLGHYAPHLTESAGLVIEPSSISNSAQNIAMMLDRSTSDPVHLQSMLDVLNRHRDQLHTNPAHEWFWQYGALATLEAMLRLDYIKPSRMTENPTPEFLVRLNGRSQAFRQWVVNTQPPESEDYQTARDLLDKGNEWRTPPDQNIRLYRMLFEWKVNATRSLGAPWSCMSAWYGAKSNADNRNARLAGYDLTRLHLARQIATLRGEAVPQTEQDFAPSYMPEFPRDPFSDQPYQFVPERGEFSSAGPDGRHGTPDDIRLPHPAGSYTPPPPMTDAESEKLRETLDEIMSF